MREPIWPQRDFKLATSLGVRLSAEYEEGPLSSPCVLKQFSGEELYIAESTVCCAHVGSCRVTKRVQRVRIPFPPPASLKCREIPLPFPLEIRERCPFFAIVLQQTGLQRPDCSGEIGVTVPAFLWRAHAQSRFTESFRRMQCDQELGIRRARFDFRPERENRFSAPPASAFIITETLGRGRGGLS